MNHAIKFHRLLLLALKGLRRNVLRTVLTILGIVIGMAAVITMTEIGQGSSTAIQKTVMSMGADNLLVQPGAATSSGVTFGAGSTVTLTPQDAEAVARECPSVHSVAPIVRARTQILYGNRNWVPVYLHGSTPDFLQVRNWQDLEDGDMFTDQDVRSAGKVCLLGQTIVRELFQGEDPIGKYVRVQNVPLRVIGVLSRKGANLMGLDEDDILLAPWTTIKYRVSGTLLGNVNQSVPVTTDTTQRVNTLNLLYPGSQTIIYPQPSPTQLADTPVIPRYASIDRILVRASSPQDVSPAMKQIAEVLRERHHISPGEPDDFNIRDMTESSKALAATAQLMSNLLLGVALISLVVCGVGIMNIMLVSVMERTREIGLRMAVGARPSDILRQFLTEAVLLCLAGGILGILLGLFNSYLVEKFLNWPTEPSLAAILAAVFVSASVGISFGYYPAWRASKLDPIEALRHE